MGNWHTQLARICAAAYEASVEPGLWPDVLADLCRAFDAAGAYTALANGVTNEVLHSLTYELPTDAVDEYGAHIIQFDPNVECLARQPARQVFFDDLHTPEQEMPRDPGYAWLCRVNGLSDYLDYRGSEDDGRIRFISLQRARSRGQATEEQIRLFSQLAPHLHRALRLTARFEHLSLRQQVIEHVADSFSCGVFILDAAARVLYHNVAAKQMTAAGDGLTLGPEGIRFASATARCEYASSFAAVTGRIGDASAAVPEIITAERPSGKRAYVIRMTPLPHCSHTASGNGQTIVFVTDPENGPYMPRDTLIRAYGLTRREADLALQLVEGKSLYQAAQHLGVQRETARSYLKRIFFKTDVNRQGELIKLILSVVPGQDSPEQSQTAL